MYWTSSPSSSICGGGARSRGECVSAPGRRRESERRQRILRAGQVWHGRTSVATQTSPSVHVRGTLPSSRQPPRLSLLPVIAKLRPYGHCEASLNCAATARARRTRRSISTACRARPGVVRGHSSSCVPRNTRRPHVPLFSTRTGPRRDDRPRTCACTHRARRPPRRGTRPGSTPAPPRRNDAISARGRLSAPAEPRRAAPRPARRREGEGGGDERARDDDGRASVRARSRACVRACVRARA